MSKREVLKLYKGKLDILENVTYLSSPVTAENKEGGGLWIV